MSWGAAKLTVDKYGPDNVVLLFADTGAESDGTYRFMWQGAQALGVELVCVRKTANDTRRYIKPWDIARMRGIIPNWKFGACAGELKKEPTTAWIKNNLPKECEIVVGFGIEEQERIDRLRRNRPEVNWSFPLAERPYTTTCKIREWLAELNVELPELYAQGFNHANCDGACFKASIGHWARLYKERPEVYRYHQEQERAWQEATGKDMTVCMYKGERITLKNLAKLIDAGIVQPEYYRLPCACGVIYYQDELELHIEGKEGQA